MPYPNYLSVCIEEGKEGKIILALKLTETVIICESSNHPLNGVLLIFPPFFFSRTKEAIFPFDHLHLSPHYSKVAKYMT